MCEDNLGPLEDGSCTCGEKKGRVEGTNQCGDCLDFCDNCKVSGTCDKCESNRDFIDEACVCPQYTFWNDTSCEDCPENCGKCENGLSCTTCKDYYIAVEGVC